jgi:hypothetical protein
MRHAAVISLLLVKPGAFKQRRTNRIGSRIFFCEELQCIFSKQKIVCVLKDTQFL